MIQFAKGTVGGLIAGLAIPIGTLQGGGHLSTLTWMITASAFLAAASGVYFTPGGANVSKTTESDSK